MTRRDRTALRLAYECVLRDRDNLTRALSALSCGDRVVRDLGSLVWGLSDVRRYGQCPPILRVRLALLLRALLRKDAGYEVRQIERNGHTYYANMPTRYQALWEYAPEHKGKS